MKWNGCSTTLKIKSAENIVKHSIRQAVTAVDRQQYVTIAGKNQKGTLLESDDFAPKLLKLKEEIASVSSTQN